MSLFALDSLWNDIYTAGGFWVGVIGLFVGVAGFWIAIVQIRETKKVAEAGKKAAEAAEEAAEKTLAESKDHYARFVGAYASRLLSSLDDAVGNKDWKLATIRVKDLAELIGSVSESIPDAKELAEQLRGFGQKFADRTPKDEPMFNRGKWNSLILKLHSELDAVNAPFRKYDHGKADPTSDRAEATGVRTDPPSEDKGGRGELGERAGDPD